MGDIIEDQIAEDIKLLNEFASNNHDVRKKIITKLEDVVDSLDLNPNEDKAMLTEAKLGVINTLLKALEDSESSKISLIKVKQKSKADQEREDDLKMISRTVVEYVKSISTNMSKPTNTNPMDDSKLDKALSDANIEILDGELELPNATAKDIEVPV